MSTSNISFMHQNSLTNVQKTKKVGNALNARVQERVIFLAILFSPLETPFVEKD